jgi:hypothetical protein
MVGHPLRGLKRTLRNSRGALHARRRRGKQPSLMDNETDKACHIANTSGPTQRAATQPHASWTNAPCSVQSDVATADKVHDARGRRW